MQTHRNIPLHTRPGEKSNSHRFSSHQNGQTPHKLLEFNQQNYLKNKIATKPPLWSTHFLSNSESFKEGYACCLATRSLWNTEIGISDRSNVHFHLALNLPTPEPPAKSLPRMIAMSSICNNGHTTILTCPWNNHHWASHYATGPKKHLSPIHQQGRNCLFQIPQTVVELTIDTKPSFLNVDRTLLMT